MWIISFRLISFLKNQTDIIASASIEAVKVKQAETVIFEFVRSMTWSLDGEHTNIPSSMFPKDTLM